MIKSKKLIIASSIAFGVGLGSLFSSPQGINAASNVIIASVEWVNAQINPINTKLASLEAKINNQQKEIASLKAQITDGVTPPISPIPDKSPSLIYIINDSVKVHSGATRDYKVVATLPKNSSSKVIDSFTSAKGLWYRVELSTTLKGWVYSGDVSVNKPEVISPTKVITKGYVHIRKGATTNYSIIQTLGAGITVKHIQSFVNANGETWYNVEMSNGKRGWMLSSLGEVR